MEKRVALIGIVVEDMESVEALNHILHEYGDYIIGRMGIPIPLPWDLYHQHCCGRPDECHQHYFPANWECSRASVSKPSIQRLGRQNDLYT